MKVAVILGGTSYEREVSLKTGKAVVEACRMNDYAVETVTIDKNYKKSLPILKKADIVFNALHGTLGEEGRRCIGWSNVSSRTRCGKGCCELLGYLVAAGNR